MSLIFYFKIKKIIKNIMVTFKYLVCSQLNERIN